MARASRLRTTHPSAEPHLDVTPQHLEDCWDEPEPAKRPTMSDLDALQGAWISVSGRRQAKLLVSGTHLALHFADGDIYLGAFSLEQTGQPRSMTVSIQEGPARHKGQTALCIYELAGDVLRWCTAGPGQKERLGAFPAEGDFRYLCLGFRREQLNG
jgi:uncharacterized protein (TIGR03067 family)